MSCRQTGRQGLRERCHPFGSPGAVSSLTRVDAVSVCVSGWKRVCVLQASDPTGPSALQVSSASQAPPPPPPVERTGWLVRRADDDLPPSHSWVYCVLLRRWTATCTPRSRPRRTTSRAPSRPSPGHRPAWAAASETSRPWAGAASRWQGWPAMPWGSWASSMASSTRGSGRWCRPAQVRRHTGSPAPLPASSPPLLLLEW